MPFLQVCLCALVFLNLELLACYKFLATSAMNGIGDDGTDCRVLNHFSLVHPAVIYQENSLFYCAFALLCFTDMQILCFCKVEGLWQRWIEQVYYWSCFCNGICSLCVSVMFCWFSKYSKVLNYFYICFGDLHSVIFNVIIAIVSGYHKSHLYETAYWIDWCCVFWLLYWRAIPYLSTSPQTTLLPKTQRYWN